MSTIDSDLTWLPHESNQDSSLPPPYPASNYHSASHTSPPPGIGPVSPLRTPAVPPQSSGAPPIPSCPTMSSHQLPADSQSYSDGQQSNMSQSVPLQDPTAMVGFVQPGEHLPLRDTTAVYRDEYEPMIAGSGEGDSLLQAEQGTYRGHSGDSDDVSDTLV